MTCWTLENLENQYIVVSRITPALLTFNLSVNVNLQVKIHLHKNRVEFG